MYYMYFEGHVTPRSLLFLHGVTVPISWSQLVVAVVFRVAGR